MSLNNTIKLPCSSADKAKQAFYKKCVADLHKAVGVKPSNVFITFTENRDIDFSFKDGIAQFVV